MSANKVPPSNNQPRKVSDCDASNAARPARDLNNEGKPSASPTAHGKHNKCKENGRPGSRGAVGTPTERSSVAGITSGPLAGTPSDPRAEVSYPASDKASTLPLVKAPPSEHKPQEVDITPSDHQLRKVLDYDPSNSTRPVRDLNNEGKPSASPTAHGKHNKCKENGRPGSHGAVGTPTERSSAAGITSGPLAGTPSDPRAEVSYPASDKVSTLPLVKAPPPEHKPQEVDITPSDHQLRKVLDYDPSNSTRPARDLDNEGEPSASPTADGKHNKGEENGRPGSHGAVGTPTERSSVAGITSGLPAGTPDPRAEVSSLASDKVSTLPLVKAPPEHKTQEVDTGATNTKDIIIAIMGPTGAGKSSFIDKATESTGKGVGHDLRSCTSEIKVTRCAVERSNVVLVDTPGFDDTTKSDLEILEMISNWLNEEYQTGTMLSAILYFHRISDNRMAGTPLKNLRVFQKLCGKNAMPKVVLVTTMWDEVDDEVGQQRLSELKDSYWKAMMSQGSTTYKYLNTRESAVELLGYIVSQERAQEGVQLQEEISDMKLELRETAAGRVLCSTLEDLAQRRMEALRRIQAESKGVDEKTAEDLWKEYAQVKAQLDSALAEARALRMSLRQRLNKSFRTIWKKVSEMRVKQ